MICPVIILDLSLALFMAMCGLYFLSYVRREGLGWLSRTVGYVTVGFGIIVFLGGVTAAMLKPSHKSCGKNKFHHHAQCDCNEQTHCQSEKVDRHVKVYRYTTTRDSLKGDKTIVRKEVEVIQK